MAGDDLTTKEARLLVFIASFVRKHQHYPKQEEMAEAMGCSDGTIRNRLKALERGGYIVRRSNKWMGLELTRKGHETAFRLAVERIEALPPSRMPGAIPIDASQLRLIPIYGSVNAGLLREEEAQEVGWYPWLPVQDASPDCFMLEVQGDSMKDAHIPSGAYVIVDPHAEPRDGDIVVALVGGENALKRLRILDDGAVLLLSENADKDYPPIHVRESDQLRIQGVVLQVVMTPTTRREEPRGERQQNTPPHRYAD